MTRSFRLVVCWLAVVSFANCSPAIPVARVSPSANHTWMAREAQGQDLLYISDGYVYVFTYPQAYSIGFLTEPHNPQGACVDAAGDVFITAEVSGSYPYKGTIYEYAHGRSKPLALLGDGYSSPRGCSVDPTTGNVGVTNYCAGKVSSQCRGDVAIYSHARGRPKRYVDSDIANYYYCSYDGSGNLFLDGTDSGGSFRFAELPKGATQFTNISLNVKIGKPGGVEWDGHYVAVGNQGNKIYRIDGAGGKAEGTISVSGPQKLGPLEIQQFWIQGSIVIGPFSSGYGGPGFVGFWHYPGGGKPVRNLGAIGGSGAAVSLAK